MQTEHLQAYALKWLQERPSLAKEQLGSPHFLIGRLMDEAGELLEAVDSGSSQAILDEWTDLANFFASLEYVMEKLGVTAEAVRDHSRYKYSIRNEAKYPAKGYQNGAPTKEQLRRDANQWAFWQAYLGIAEIGAGGEYY